jgi:hypothetical protein
VTFWPRTVPASAVLAEQDPLLFRVASGLRLRRPLLGTGRVGHRCWGCGYQGSVGVGLVGLVILLVQLISSVPRRWYLYAVNYYTMRLQLGQDSPRCRDMTYHVVC